MFAYMNLVLIFCKFKDLNAKAKYSLKTLRKLKMIQINLKLCLIIKFNACHLSEFFQDRNSTNIYFFIYLLQIFFTYLLE